VSSPDKYLVAFAGNDQGELWFIDYRQPEGHTHRLLRPDEATHDKPLCLGDLLPGPRSGVTDTLKFSRVARFGGVYVRAGIIRGGTEDCIDVNNRCADLHLDSDQLEPLGKYACTTKGESTRIHHRVGLLVGHGSEQDFDYGNRSEQAEGRTTACTLHVEATTDGAARVRVLHAHRPTTTGGPGVRFDTAARFKGFIAWLFDLFPLIFR
jgi:hypothetical protein